MLTILETIRERQKLTNVHSAEFRELGDRYEQALAAGDEPVALAVRGALWARAEYLWKTKPTKPSVPDPTGGTPMAGRGPIVLQIRKAA